MTLFNKSSKSSIHGVSIIRSSKPNMGINTYRLNINKTLALFFLFFQLLLSITNVFSQTTITIETGSAGTDDAILDPYFAYNYSQQIYLNTEITADGGVSGQQITKIRFFYFTDAGDESKFNNWTVYAGNTTKATFSGTSDWVAVGSMTQVFSGTVTFPAAGNWVEITLPTPFTWTGNNLIIAVDENSSSYASDYNCWRYTSTSSNYRTIYYNNDVTNPNPASPPTASGRTYTRPDIQFVLVSPCTPPTAVTVSGGGTFCNSAVLTASGGTGGTIYWQNTTSGGTSTANSTNPQTVTSSGTYYFRSYNSTGGCWGPEGSAAVIIFSSVPAQPSSINGPAAPCQGATVSYSVTNVPGVTYTWSFPSGFTINSGQGTNSVSVSLSGASSGNVSVTPSNACGSGTPRTLAVTPGAGPTVTISPNPASACGGTGVVLTASGSTSYSWSPAAGLSATTGASVTANPTTTTTYTVTETGSGCNNTASVEVKVGPSVSVTANVNPTAVCPGSTVNLTSTPSEGGTLLSQNFQSAIAPWTLTNTNVAAVAWTLRNSPYSTSGEAVSSGSQFVQSNSDAGGSGSSGTTTITSPSFSLVGYSTANLNFRHYYRHYSGGTSYVDVYNGSSWVNLATYSSTQGTYNSFANVNLSLNAYVGIANVQVRFRYVSAWCYNWNLDDIIISGTNTTPGLFTYLWGSSPAGFSSSSQNPTANPSVNTIYTVTITRTSSGCTASASTAQVTMNPVPAQPVISGLSTVCSGTAGVVYTITNAPIAYATSYTWSVPTGSTFLPASPSASTTITVTYGSTSGNVTCYATDACGRNSTTANFAVTVLAAPAAPTTTGATACGVSSVLLSASGSPAHYHWYDAAVGGNLVNDGPSTYNTPPISIPTTYYVATNNGSCDGPRAPVTAGIFMGGLDAYTVSRTTGITYTDISGTGTSVTSWKNGTTHPTGMSDYDDSKDDNLSTPITIPFSFPFDGGNHTSLLVGLDGFITFNTATKADGADLAACGPPEPYTWQNDNFSVSGRLGTLQAIAPFYNDLYCNNAITATCYYKTDGSAPNRIFTVQWTNVYNDIYCSGSSCSEYPGNLYFQVKLYETSGNIEFWYGPTMTQTTYNWCESGDDCTIDDDYTSGLNSSTLSASPTISQLFTQQTANTATFSNTAQNGLTTLPAINSKIILTRTAPAAPTQIPSSICNVIDNYPANGATNQCLNQILSWSPGDGIPTSYDVYFGTSNPPVFVVNTTQTFYNPGNLNMTTTYYWKIVPKNSFGAATNVQIYSFATGVGDQQPHEITSDIGTLVSHVASGTDVDGHTIYTNTYEVCPSAQNSGTLTAWNYTLSEGSELDWTTPFYFFGWPIVQCTGAIPSDIWGNCDGGTQTPILTFTSWLTAMFNGGYVIYDVFTRGCNDNVGCTRIILHLNSDNKAPTSVTASPNPVCQGSTTTTLTANGATLSPGASYVWYTGGCGTTFLANTGSTNTLVVSPSVTTTYWVRVEGGTYCASTTGCKSVVVTVNNPVSSSAPNISVCTGMSAITMTGATAGGTVSSVAWSGGAGLGSWAGAENNPATYTFTPSVPNGSFTTTLTVYGTSPCGNTSSNGTIAWGTGPGGWNGSYSTNWYDDRNWCVYPTCSDDIAIPSSTVVLNQPTIDPSLAGIGPVPHAANTAACKNMLISSGATLTMTNDANLNVCGDWTNNGTFIKGNGSVTFMGSAAQNINASAHSFYDLIISNSGTGVTLVGGDVTFTNVLTLNDGILHTGVNKIIGTSFGYASIVPGGSNNSIYEYSWVNGWIRRSFNNNAGDYDFPVGTASFPALLKLTNTTITAGTPPTYFVAKFLTGIEYSNNDNFNSTIANDFDMAYGDLEPNGIWYFQPDGNIVPNGGSNYALKLFFAKFPPVLGFLIDNEFGIVKRPISSTSASDWTTQTSEGAGPVNTTGNPGSMNLDNGQGRLVSDGYALRFGMSSFSNFGIAKKTGTLPVELYYFRALCYDNKTNLIWSTLSETSNDFFTLEKSINSIDFDFLAKINGAGTSNQMLSYSYIDDEPYSETTYYRLSQTDYDGVTDNLGIVTAKCNNESNEITIYPNPANDIVYLYFNDNTEETFYIDMYSNLGELVYQKKISTINGNNIIPVITSHFAEGLYTIVINHPTKYKVSYLLIKK